MQESKKYYEEKLYPLQNTILKLLNEIHTPFYLTGGRQSVDFTLITDIPMI
jgi:hypothetical protein